MPLTQALRARRSTRTYADRALSMQQLSDLLWSACGINRASGERTAPYRRHVMVLDVYVALPDGVCRYEPHAHALTAHLDGDLRAVTGQQDFVATALLESWGLRCICPRAGS